jgi:hypothetical protein
MFWRRILLAPRKPNRRAGSLERACPSVVERPRADRSRPLTLAHGLLYVKAGPRDPCAKLRIPPSTARRGGALLAGSASSSSTRSPAPPCRTSHATAATIALGSINHAQPRLGDVFSVPRIALVLRYSITIWQERPISALPKPDISPDRKWGIPMKGVVLAAFVAVAVGAGIASAGIASLAGGAAVLINATASQTYMTPRLAMDAR